MSETTGSLFDDLNEPKTIGSGDAVSTDSTEKTEKPTVSDLLSADSELHSTKTPAKATETKVASLDITPAGAVEKPQAETKLASAGPQIKVDLPKVNLVAPVATSHTLTLADANAAVKQTDIKAVDRGFGVGLLNSGLDMVSGTAGIFVNENKTHEERIINPDVRIAQRIEKTGSDIGTVASNVYHDWKGDKEDTGTKAALGKTLTGFYDNLKSGNMESWGYGTGVALSVLIPGGGAAKGTTGLTDDLARAGSIAKSTSILDDTARMAGRLTSVEDDALRLAGKATAGTDDLSRLGTRVSQLPTKKPSIVTSLQNRFLNPVRDKIDEVAEGLVPKQQLAFQGAGGPAVRLVPDELAGTLGRTTVKAGDDVVGRVTSAGGRNIDDMIRAAGKGTTTLDDGIRGAASKPGVIGRTSVPVVDDTSKLINSTRKALDGVIDETKLVSVQDDLAKVEAATRVIARGNPTDEVLGSLDTALKSLETTIGKEAPKTLDDLLENVSKTTGRTFTRTSSEVVQTGATKVIDNVADAVKSTSRLVDDALDPTTAAKVQDDLRVVEEATKRIASGNAPAQTVRNLDEAMTRLGSTIGKEAPDAFKDLSTKVSEATGRTFTKPVVEVVQGGAGKVIDNVADAVKSTSRLVDDALDPTTAAKVQDDLRVVEEATKRIASGNAPAQTVRNLDEAMTRLGSTIGKEAPDAFKDLSTKVSEATGRTFTKPVVEVVQGGAGKVIDNVADAVKSTSRLVDDALDPTTAAKVQDDLRVVEEATKRIASGNAPAQTVRNLDEAMTRLGSTIGKEAPDAFKDLSTKVSEATGRTFTKPVVEVVQTGAGKVIDNVADAVKSTSRLVDDAFDPTTAAKVQDDLRVVEEATKRIASGNAPAQTFRSLETAMNNLGKTVGDKLPGQLDDITRQVNKIAPREVVKRVVETSDNFAATSKVLANQADDFTRVFDDLAARSTTSGGKSNIETVTRLTREVAEGSADGNTITKLNNLVDDIAKGLGPDDAKRLTNSVDELTNAARQSTLTREIARGTSNTLDNFTGLSNSLDDVATKFTGETATKQIDRVRELSTSVARGTADGDTVRLLNEAVEQLGKTVGDDAIKGIRSNTDNLIASTNRTSNVMELSRGLVTTTDNMTSAAAQLTTAGDDFGRVLGEVAPKVSGDAAESLKTVETLGRQIADGATDTATLNKFNNAVRDLNKALGPDDMAKLTNGSDDLARAAQNSNVVNQVARQTANTTDNLTSLTKGLDDLSVKVGDDVASKQIDEIKKLSETVARQGSDQNAVRALNQSIENLGKALGPEHADDIARIASGADDLSLNASKLTLTKEVARQTTRTSESFVKLGSTLDDMARSGADATQVNKVRNLANQVAQGNTSAQAVKSLNEAVEQLGKSAGDDVLKVVRAQTDELFRSSTAARATREITEEIGKAIDNVSSAGNQLSRSGADVTDALTGIAQKVTAPAGNTGDDFIRKFTDVKKYSDRIAAGATDADTIRNLNKAVSDLGKVLGPDDMQKVVNKVDDLTTNAHRANLAKELARQTVNTGDEFARLTRTFDDVATNLTDDVARQNLAKARQLSENIARGTGDARSVVELNNTVRALEKVLDPADFNALNTRTSTLTQAAQRSNTVREALTQFAKAGDELAGAGRVLTNTADDISEALTTVSTRTGGKVARSEVDSVQRLTRQVADGATDSNTINKLHQAVRELGETLGPQYSDDFGRIASKVDDLTLNAQRSSIAKEVVTQSAKLQDNFAGMTRTLDDLAVRAPDKATKIDAVRELGRTLASGNAKASTVRQFNRAVRDLGDSLGTNFSDDFAKVLSRSDDMSSAARRTIAAREIAGEVGKVSDNLVSAARQLGRHADDFSATLDDVLNRSGKPASETAESVKTVREMGARVANGIADESTMSRFNNALDDLRKVLDPEDFAKLRSSADDLGVSARNMDVARVVARESGKAGESAMMASRTISSSFDDISGNVSKMLEGPLGSRTGVASDLRVIESATGKIARGTQEARTINQLERAMAKVSKEIGSDPALRSQFDDLSRNVERLVGANRQANIAREVGETLVKSGDDVVRETTKVTTSATRVQNSVNQIRNKVIEGSDDLLVRELDEITNVSRQIANGAVDPVNLGKLETSVTRLSQLGGTRLGDDLVNLADDTRNLIRTSRNLRSAQETFAVTSKSASQIPAISTNFATRSQNLSNTLNNLAQRASQARVPQIADDLKTLEQVTKQIGTRTESAASLRRAEAALNRLAKTSNTQLGDDIARVVDDTRNLIRTSRTQGPLSFVRATGDDIIKASDDLSARVASHSRANLPQNLVKELDNIKDASMRIGRSGSDDALEMSNIQRSLNTLRSSGTRGQTIADDLSSSIEKVQKAAVQSRRSASLANATERATTAADEIKTIAQRTLETTRPSRFVRRQLNDIIEASDNALTSSNPTVAIKSIEKSIEKLGSRGAVPQGLERSVRVLDDATNTASALRKIQSSEGLVSRARTLVLNSADDGSVVAAGSKTKALESLTQIEDDLNKLATASTRQARETINENIRGNLTRLRETGNARFANEIDEAVTLRNLETVGAHNAQLATSLESATQKLVAGSTESGARVAETTALTKIETVAREIASGNTNPTLVSTLESNLGKLSASNQNILRPLLNELKAGVDDHAGLAVRVRQTSSQVVLDDLARIPTRSDFGAQLDLIADVRQRLSLIKEVNGSSTELVGQISENMLALESSLGRAARPTNLTSNGQFLRSLFGGGSSRFSVDGLSSTSGKVSALAPATRNPGLIEIGKVILNDPAMRRSVAYNSALMIGGGIGTGFVIKQHLDNLAENVVLLRDSDPNRKPIAKEEVAPLREPEPPVYLKFDKKSGEEARVQTAAKEADMDFSPHLGELVRKSGLFNLTEAEVDIVKRTGVTGSKFDIDRAVHDLTFTGKARSWSQIASVAAASVETALTINYGFRPVKFSIIDDGSQEKGAKVSFERVAQGRFSPMKIKDIMNKLDSRKSADPEEKRNTLYSGNYAQSGTGLSTNLRMANNSYGSVKLVSEGMERVEPKLDNTANATGSASQNPNTFTTYSDPSGIHVAKADPANNQDDEENQENSDKLYNEALQEASDVV